MARRCSHASGRTVTYTRHSHSKSIHTQSKACSRASVNHKQAEGAYLAQRLAHCLGLSHGFKAPCRARPKWLCGCCSCCCRRAQPQRRLCGRCAASPGHSSRIVGPLHIAHGATRTACRAEPTDEQQGSNSRVCQWFSVVKCFPKRLVAYLFSPRLVSSGGVAWTRRRQACARGVRAAGLRWTWSPLAGAA